MPDWDVDGEGNYGISNNNAAVESLLLDRLQGTDDGVSVFVPSASATATTTDGPPTFSRWISDLSNEPFVLIKPIPVIVEEHAPQEYTARFREANIAMSGESIQEAMQYLLADILNCYEDLTEEPIEMLGAGPREQLQVLQAYLRNR